MPKRHRQVTLTQQFAGERGTQQLKRAAWHEGRQEVHLRLVTEAARLCRNFKEVSMNCVIDQNSCGV